VDRDKFKSGDCVKVIFRPEDVSLTRGEFLRQGLSKISTAIIEEIAFVGAYERLRLRLDRGEECKTDDTPYYLTTETPDRQATKAIIATRPKPEASATRLHVGERVVVALTSFTILPSQRTSWRKKY
jgi:hypothetical protein